MKGFLTIAPLGSVEHSRAQHLNEDCFVGMLDYSASTAEVTVVDAGGQTKRLVMTNYTNLLVATAVLDLTLGQLERRRFLRDAIEKFGVRVTEMRAEGAPISPSPCVIPELPPWGATDYLVFLLGLIGVAAIYFVAVGLLTFK